MRNLWKPTSAYLLLELPQIDSASGRQLHRWARLYDGRTLLLRSGLFYWQEVIGN